MRVQLALNVENLEEAIEFYSKLFDVKVNKRKPGYANFAIEQPPLKLVLFENPDADERLNHLGVEVFDDADVHAATDRLKAAGLVDSVEDEQTCCYATSEQGLGARSPGHALGVLPDQTFGAGGDFEAPAESATGCCG